MVEHAVIIATGSPHHDSGLVQDRPHAMLPALGKPLVARMMDQIYQVGIRKFFIVVGVSEGTVASYLNRQWMPDVNIELVFKADNDSLSKVIHNIATQLGKSFLISHYNNFCHANFIATLMKQYQEHPSHVILAGAQHSLNQHAHHTYAMSENKQVLSLVRGENIEGTANAYLVNGLAICGKAFVDYSIQARNFTSEEKTSYFVDVVAQYLAVDGAQVTLANTSWLLQVESDTDLLILNRKLLNETHDHHILSEIPYTAKIIPPVRIDPRVSIGQDAIIGPNVYLEQGSTVGYGARVRDAIVLDRGTISANTTVENDIIGRRGSILKQS